MNKLSEHFDQLLAQRCQMNTTFYSFKTNVDENTKKLLLSMKLLTKDSPAFGSLFAAETPQQLIAFLQSDHGYEREQLVYALQVKLMMNQATQAEIVTALISENSLESQEIAADLVMVLPSINNLLWQNQVTNTSELVYNSFLLKLYYQRQLVSYLQLPNKHKNNRQGKQSALTSLYLKVLTLAYTSSYEVIEQFIELDYLNSHLFEIFILSLNEFDVTQAVNVLSSDIKLTRYAMKSMSLSGYSKFIPYLARYLQKESLSIDAFNGLKLMLGDELNQFIAIEIQTNSDEAQRVKDFPYYGAKIIAAWQKQADIFNAQQLLNGLAIDIDNIELTSMQGSQQHRYIANIHKLFMLSEQPIYPFNSIFYEQVIV